MSRRLTALKPQLNRIRAWAHEGSTDAWIAHQLETSAEAVRAFRQEHGIERGGPAPLAPITPDSVVEAMLAEEEATAAAGEPAPEPDVAASDPQPEPEAAVESAPVRAPRSRSRQRAAKPAEDAPDAAAAVAAEAPESEEATPASDAPDRGSSRRRGARGGSGRGSGDAAVVSEADDEAVAEADDGEATSEAEPSRSASSRKRGRRRGRGRGAGRGLEARLLSGSVLLLDPSVAADAAFQEHWQDAGPLRVEISADAIVLRRVTADAEPDRSQG
jgi:hypothetical protein